MRHTRTLLLGLALVGSMLATAPRGARADDGPSSGQKATISTVASTVPSNGDVNPYGVAVIPESMGRLVQGNILVSNFNNSANQQGTGTTIVEITPRGGQMVFARINGGALPGACPGGVGLTTALAVLRSGWVIVGSLPTTDGTAATAGAGCLIVLDSLGRVTETIAGGGIDGPWDMTALDEGSQAELFVSNVLSGTVAGNGQVVNGGTVVRLRLANLEGRLPVAFGGTIIGSGFAERTDPGALVIGPTGLGLGRLGTLYVADSLNNRIAAIPAATVRLTSAGTGVTVSTGGALNDPLGLMVAPGGAILSVNGDDGNLVATTPAGQQVAVTQLDNTGSPAGSGTLFGLAADRCLRD